MARILCDNTDDLTDIQVDEDNEDDNDNSDDMTNRQTDVFKMADNAGNSPLACSDPTIPTVDMERFREASRP